MTRGILLGAIAAALLGSGAAAQDAAQVRMNQVGLLPDGSC